MGKNSAQETLGEGEELGCTILELVFSNPYNSIEVDPMPPLRPFPSPNSLTDDEFAFLDSFLRKANSGRAMNLEEMDGFVTALVCGPQMVMPSEYMPHASLYPFRLGSRCSGKGIAIFVHCIHCTELRSESKRILHQ